MSYRKDIAWLKRFTIITGATIVALMFCLGINSGTNGRRNVPSDPPSYLPWYNTPSPWPSPITSAFVGIAGAIGAANYYNTSTNGFTPQVDGLGMLGTGLCYFVCYGGQGTQSHHYLIYGNDVDASGSYTHQGAADDCNIPGFLKCPGGVSNQILAITAQVSPVPTGAGYLMAIDGGGNLGAPTNIYGSAAVVAGAGLGTPAPAPSYISGSLVSFVGTSPARGELILGKSTGAAKCDFGESTALTITCNQALIVSRGGIRPNGSANAYVPEAFPGSPAGPHPKILSGTCVVSSLTACTFPNSFTFHDVFYNCMVSAEGTTPLTSSYSRTSATTITISSSSSSTATFSYICTR